MTESGQKQSVILKGIVGSHGVCAARSYVFRKRIEVKRTPITDEQIDKELERLEAAVKITAGDIENCRRRAEERHGEKYAAIFEWSCYITTMGTRCEFPLRTPNHERVLFGAAGS